MPVRSLHVRTVLIRFPVAIFDEWRPRYDNALERTIGVKSAQVLRGQDDPDLVVIAEVNRVRRPGPPYPFRARRTRWPQTASICRPCESSSPVLDDAGQIER